jgi:catechol 2,3-dioxygenase-like lactoylglutathione lyase family enzyme
MRITLTSVLVDDQAKALRFYTDVLGFAKKADVPLGEHRWLTVVSPESPDGPELVLEPDEHPAARPFKDALVRDGIPFTSFGVDDVRAEFARLTACGVRFTHRLRPQSAGRVPYQSRSASSGRAVPPSGSALTPTASHAVAEVHATAWSIGDTLGLASGTGGVGEIDHVEPSQC